MCAEAGIGNGAWVRRRRGTPAWLSRRETKATPLGRMARRGKNLRAKVCETRARLTKKTRDSTHKARSSVGRDSAGDEVCLAGAPRRLVLCAPARLCKKCRQTPYSNRTTFPPTFPHSAPRGRVEGARLGLDGPSAALGGPPAAPRPGCKKCRQTPISTLTSFTPLFPTLRTRRPGAVLRARGSVLGRLGCRARRELLRF